MSTQNFIRITFFVSVLVFNPAVADAVQIAANIQSRISTTITQDIASVLYRKGLEEKTADERARELVGDDAEAFAAMLDHLLHDCNAFSREEILDYMADAALRGQQIELNSYDQLLGIYSKVTRMVPDEEVRKNLAAIAKRNSLLLA